MPFGLDRKQLSKLVDPGFFCDILFKRVPFAVYCLLERFFAPFKGSAVDVSYLSKRCIRTSSLTPDSRGVPMSFVTYNILSEHLVSPGWLKFPYCPPSFLVWGYRLPRIVAELKALDSDVVCLQEVSSGAYKQISASLAPHYTSIPHMKYHGRDGVAIFYRSRFKLVQVKYLDMDELAQAACSTLVSPASAGTNLYHASGLESGAVGLVLGLESENTCFVVGNVHLDSFWLRPDRQAVQLGQSFDEVDAFARSMAQSGESVPYVICGDHNIVPTSMPYTLASTGTLPVPEFKTSRVARACARAGVDVQRALSAFRLQHTLGLRSAYAAVLGLEPVVTNFTRSFDGCLDYIWTSRGAPVVEVLDTPSMSVLKATKGCPNAVFPSDHISLKAVVMLPRF